MGYTNYWSRPAEISEKDFSPAVHDVHVVLEHFKGELAGPDGLGGPIANGELIAFNGRRPRYCESFYFRRIQKPDEEDIPCPTFCKTRMMPYDLTVKMVLLVLQHHLGDSFEYGSDGGDGPQWRRAKRVCREILGYPEPDPNPLRRLAERLLSV